MTTRSELVALALLLLADAAFFFAVVYDFLGEVFLILAEPLIPGDLLDFADADLFLSVLRMLTAALALGVFCSLPSLLSCKGISNGFTI